MKSVTVLVIAMLALGLPSCRTADDAEKASNVELKTFDERYSYALGMDIAAYAKGLPLKIDLAIVGHALNDVLEKVDPALSPKEADEVRKEFREMMQKEQERRMSERDEKQKGVGEANKKEGEAFLAENGKKKGVVTTKSGLQYLVIKEGAGPKPKATDAVSVHYVGTLLNGEEFDSSRKRGQPAVFPLNRVIAGWTEGLQLMPVGSNYKLFVPPHIGYGEKGGGPIGPNCTLIFDVELLEIVDKPRGKGR